MQKQEFRIIAVLIILSIVLFSCQGPAGPDGDDAFLVDSLAPELTWLTPAAGSSNADTIILSARAFDDQELYRMVFYIAGIEKNGVLVDSVNSIYQYKWLAYLYPAGPYPLMARAWDASRNMSTTPVLKVDLTHPVE